VGLKLPQIIKKALRDLRKGRPTGGRGNSAISKLTDICSTQKQKQVAAGRSSGLLGQEGGLVGGNNRCIHNKNYRKEKTTHLAPNEVFSEKKCRKDPPSKRENSFSGQLKRGQKIQSKKKSTGDQQKPQTKLGSIWD